MKPFIFKTVVVLFILGGGSGKISAQNSVKVPSNITARFAQGFSNSSDVSSRKSSGTAYYESDFVDGDHYKKVAYSATGSFVFSETRLSRGQLPENVSKTISTEFFGFDVDHIRRVETVREVTVKFRIRDRNARYEVEIDLSGKVRAKRRLPEEHEDEHYEHDHDHDDDDEHDHDDDHGKWHKHKKKHKRDCDEDDD